MSLKLTRLALWVGLCMMSGATLAPTHSLRVYSEFQRIDPFGKVVAADRAQSAGPREILSPAVARNAFASFHLAVTVRPGQSFTLHVGQNPDDSFRVSVYKEVYTKCEDSWIPDRLEPVTLPYTGRLPDQSNPIRGQTTVVFWMDMWVPFDAKVGRVKVQPQTYSDGYWITYPMEVRVTSPIIPRISRPTTSVAAIEEPADTTARQVLAGYLCGLTSENLARQNTVRQLILRNSLQDAALARSLEKTQGKNVLWPLMLRLAGSAGEGAWCDALSRPGKSGAEWYLQVRNALDRMVN